MTIPRLSLTFAVLALVSCKPQFGLAQINLPFQVTAGSGNIVRLPTPDNPVQGHDMKSGSAIFNGETLSYTGIGTVRALGVADPVTSQIPFQSDTAFLFDFGNGDTLRMHYGHPELGAPSTGRVSISPLPSGLVDVTWLATFNPVPGSGTGKFANVIAGSIFMTARQDSIDPTGADVPYRWSSDEGFLTVVPEPATGLLMTALSLGWLAMRPRQSTSSRTQLNLRA